TEEASDLLARLIADEPVLTRISAAKGWRDAAEARARADGGPVRPTHLPQRAETRDRAPA
ncbi:MAG: chlorophyllide reductase subunit Z, partial [Pseudomonadota bacterium]